MQAMWVPHSWQKYRAPWEEDSIFLGSQLIYSKQSLGPLTQETNAAPEVRLHIEQSQLAEG